MTQKVSRNAPCRCGSGKKYKKCCLPKEEKNNQNNRSEDSKSIIKEFQYDKRQKALVHPYCIEKTRSSETIDIYLVTLGHLWIYQLIENNGYGEYLYDFVQYSMKKKNSLFEWEIDKKEINEILCKYNLQFRRYLDNKFNIFKYSDVIEKSKSKEHPYHRLTRLLVLARENKVNEILSFEKTDIEKLLKEYGTIINAAYLLIDNVSKNNNEPLITAPDSLIEVIKKNMECKVEPTKMKYYPKLEIIMSKLSQVENMFASKWYLIPDNEQVIISKFLYSIRIVKELSITLLGLNGILASFATRVLFDNYWQSKFLIKHNKIADYRDFALDRMRLHILKRTGREDVISIDDLLSEIAGDVLEPIPINGDYFNKSAREYAIELDIKDDYDKCYEYNSEFIHASLTAIYSGLMVQCTNPEHNNHLTIHPGGSRLIDSMPHIFEILNKHIDLLNDYFEFNIIERFDMSELFYKDRQECYDNGGMAYK